MWLCYYERFSVKNRILANYDSQTDISVEYNISNSTLLLSDIENTHAVKTLKAI